MELNQLTIFQLAKTLSGREASARQAVESCLKQIERVDKTVHAFLSVDAKDALAQADAIDKEIASGVTRVAWSPDSKLLAVGGEAGEVQVLAVE